MSRGKREHRSSKLLSLLKVVGVVLVLLAFFYVVKNREYFLSALMGKGRVSILLYSSKDSLLAVLDPQDNTLTLVGIPGDLYVELPNGYGSYRFNAVYKLGNLDNKGSNLVKATASNLFAIQLDGLTVDTFDITLGDGTQNIDTLRKQILSFGFLRKTVLSSDPVLFRFWWNARNIKASDTKILNLVNSDSVSDLLLPDGTHAYRFDSFFYDRLEAPLIRDSKVIAEGYKVEVFNGSSVNGLAEKFSRYLTNFGLTVLSVSTADEEPTVCRIKFDEKIKNSYTLYRLVKDFGCIYEPFALSDIPKSDLAIILGVGFENRAF